MAKIVHSYTCPSHGIVATQDVDPADPHAVAIDVRCSVLATSSEPTGPITYVCGQVAAWSAVVEADDATASDAHPAE